MHQFANLILDLENTSSTSKKTALMKSYFDTTPDDDKLWAIALFSHRRPKRQVNTKLLTTWALELTGIPSWLFQESYSVVGDLAETISLVLPPNEVSEDQSLSFWVNYLKNLSSQEEDIKKSRVLHAWNILESQERFVFNKLITGGFRVGLSKSLMIKALSQSLDIDNSIVSHMLMGDWSPDEVHFKELLDENNGDFDHSKPYPYYLAYPLEGGPTSLGEPSEWSAEWKWDGIRSQLIVRNQELFIWSRGEELITDKFPELSELVNLLPDGIVIDGELLPFDGQPLPFNVLQTRIGRKTVTKKLLKDAPAIIYAYDLLEFEGKDLRNRPFEERRSILQKIVQSANNEKLKLSESIPFESWDTLIELREKSRDYHAEGLMLKRKSSDYKIGRKRGDWWKWKVDPLTVDAVMVYAQMGHGRRADLFSDFTFAVWNGQELVTFAKAYSGLTDKELNEITKFVRANTKEKFGPVRTVTPSQVFEIHFEGIAESKRHKSGIAVRFPRVHRWRKDKRPEEANTLEDLKSLINI